MGTQPEPMGYSPASGRQSEETARVLLQLGGVVFLLAFFIFFAGSGLWAPLSGDDLMNLHGHLQTGALGLMKGLVFYWSTEYRPLGGLFYLSIYKLFGFDPLPFRIESEEFVDRQIEEST